MAGNAERNLNPGATCQLRVGDELIRVGAGRVQKDHKLVAAQIKNESRPVMLTFKRHEQAESEVEPAGPLVLRGPGDVVMACSDGLVLGRGMLGLAASDKKLSSTHSIIEATGDSAFLIRPQGKHLLLMRRANGDYGAVGRDVGVASAGLRVGDRIYLGKREDKSREVLVEIGELDVGEAEAPSSEPSSPRSSGEVLAAPTPAPAHEQPEPPMKVAVVEEAEPPEQPSTEAPAAQPRSRPKRKQKAGLLPQPGLLSQPGLLPHLAGEDVAVRGRRDVQLEQQQQRRLLPALAWLGGFGLKTMSCIAFSAEFQARCTSCMQQLHRRHLRWLTIS